MVLFEQRKKEEVPVHSSHQMSLCSELISQRLGIRVRSQDAKRLERTLRERCELHQLTDLGAYAAFLQAASPSSRREWDQLASLLTTGETFFFRGKAHMDALRNQILPNLIQNREVHRSLRIWSAGCSSGEEAYSIAILLDELLCKRHNWSVKLLATDIDVEALSKARRGVYTDWSFRKVDPIIQEKYFRRVGNAWELDPQIKKMVTFERLNLLTDAFPDSMVGKMDLIICRNVFIYFSGEDVASIIKKFGSSLRDGGYLLAGHGELQGQDTAPLVKRTFADAMVLQRNDSRLCDEPSVAPFVAIERKGRRLDRGGFSQASVHQSAGPSPQPQSPAAVTLSDDAIEKFEALIQHGSNVAGLEKAMLLAGENPGDARVCSLIAQGHANFGNHKEAIAWCQKAMAVDSFAVDPQYLLANIAEAEGRHDEAKSFLRKVIYLDSSHVPAQLALAGLYEREGDLDQAKKTRLGVVELLKSKPSGFSIQWHGETVMVADLVQQINQTVTHG